MDDLISRQAAIDALADYIHNVDRVYSTGKLTHDDCMDAAHSVLDELPSAQPTDAEIQRMQDIEQAALEKAYECGKQDAQRWIPCSERLPEGICQAIVQTNGGAIHEVFYKGKNDYGHEVWMRFDGGIYWDDEVVAWMPLPEPYKRNTDG